MMSRLIDLCLVAAALTGLFFVWQTGQKRQATRLEYERLVRLTGDLAVTDSSKVHVLALDTGEPLHFAWRIYLPKGSLLKFRHPGGSGSSSSRDGEHLIARVRFREDKDGQLQVYKRFSGVSGQSGFGNKSLAAFLRGRWDQVAVEQLGAGKPAIVEPNEEAQILRLTLPEALHSEATEKVDSRSLQAKLPLLYEVHITVGQTP
jgi:hypothetical protein